MLEKLSFLIVAVLAGLGGGFLSGKLHAAPAPHRAAARAVAVQRFEDVTRRLTVLESVTAQEPEPVAKAAKPAVKPAPADDLSDIVGKKFDHTLSDRFFYRLTRSPDRIDSLIGKIRQEIKKDPTNADLWCAFATAYGARTATMTPGPEQGPVWELAVQAYDEAIRLDKNHWEARYGKAFGTSMAPEFVGLRPEAIRQFEELVDVQERQAPTEEHVLVYTRLGTLFKNAGNVKRAREVWEQGLRRFPSNKQLVESLDLIGDRDG